MRIVVQRVLNASVTVGEEKISQIGRGFLVLLGVEEGDGEADAVFIAGKIAGLRVFEDDAGKMNRSVLDVSGEVLLVSQFTLLGDARTGKRPSFIRAMRPSEANALCERVLALLREQNVPTQTGVFGADMQVALVNDGPVTILLDSHKLF
jgi:D-tyrosyl-tRNA(Tyr) deacylase